VRSTIVITGGAGFIGSNLVAAFAARGDRDVVVCDRLGSDGRWRNIARHEVAEIVAPERLIDALGAIAGNLAGVVHMGANSSTTATDADAIYASNAAFTLDLWRWCAAHEARLVYASSAAVYGDGAQGFDDDPAPEAMARLRPLNLYGWSKLFVDRRIARLLALGAAAPPQWAGLRLFNVYGPNEGHKGEMRSLVAKTYPQAAAGEPITLFKSHRPGIPDGGQQRDFVYVKDCVDVVLWLLDNPGVSGLFNVGTGRARSFAELAQALYAACGTRADIRYRDMPEDIREQYQYFTEARLDRLRRAGYSEPFRAIEEGVRDYVQNHLARPDAHA
jgi:ADP-L-glycero-D-manno-heptose 6-epimerase